MNYLKVDKTNASSLLKHIASSPFRFTTFSESEDFTRDLVSAKEFPASREIKRSENYCGKSSVLNVTAVFMAVGINSTRQ